LEPYLTAEDLAELVRIQRLFPEAEVVANIR
jgi:hypothetical protein